MHGFLFIKIALVPSSLISIDNVSGRETIFLIPLLFTVSTAKKGGYFSFPGEQVTLKYRKFKLNLEFANANETVVKQEKLKYLGPWYEQDNYLEVLRVQYAQRTCLESIIGSRRYAS